MPPASGAPLLLAAFGLVSMLAFASAGDAPDPGSPSGPLPAIVFVSREPASDRPASVIPGLGPNHRTLVTGGRLLVREPDGFVRELLAAAAMHDVSDPAVSFDATTVAFAGVVHPDSAWRIYSVRLDGSELTQLTFSDRQLDLSPLGSAATRFERYDDFDPVWTDNHLVCFASTRYPQRSQYADLPVSNLFLVHTKAVQRGIRMRRLTSERNGAEEPAVDHVNSRVVFSRWWFNRHRPASGAPGGLTLAPADATAPDSANLWHGMEMVPLEGAPPRLAAHHPRSRLAASAYQPAVLSDGSLVAVYGLNLGLSPTPVATGIHRFRDRFSEPERLIGAAVDEGPGDPYEESRGLAPPSACAPAGLPDGRILFSWAPGARGDFGLYVMTSDGEDVQKVLDLPGTLELDAAPVVTRPKLKQYQEQRRIGRPPPDQPIVLESELFDRGRTFRFQCLNVFGGGVVDSPIPDPIPVARDLRIRFFALLSRPERAGGDTAVLVTEVPVGPRGAIDVRGLPADVPMFEQIVDADGDIVTSPHGGFMKAAHVAGANVGSPPYVARCIGCHVGHSALVRDEAPANAEWFNASPSATASGSSTALHAHADAAIDRVTRGRAADVAWIAAVGGAQGVRLNWDVPIEVGAVVLYNVRPGEATDLQVRRCEVIMREAGRKVGHRFVDVPLSPDGTRVEVRRRQIDELEVRVLEFDGRVEDRPVASLAEIETIARLPRR